MPSAKAQTNIRRHKTFTHLFVNLQFLEFLCIIKILLNDNRGQNGMRQSVKRYISVCVIAVLLTVSLSGCYGYNKLMREHLSNPDNYYEFTVEVTRIYTYDGDNYDNRSTDISCSADVDANSDLFYIEDKVLSGNYQFVDGDYYEKQIEIQFELSRANVLYLLSTDFYDVAKVGTQLNIRSTMWIYGDREWQYVAEIKLDDAVYLGFNDGLQNITEYMNANKSLL